MLFFIPRLAIFLLNLLSFISIPSDSSFNLAFFLSCLSLSLPSSPTCLHLPPASPLFLISLSCTISNLPLFLPSLFLFHLSSLCCLSVPSSFHVPPSFSFTCLPSSTCHCFSLFLVIHFSRSLIFPLLPVIAFLFACPSFSRFHFSSLSFISPNLPTFLPSIFLFHLPSLFLLLIITSILACPSFSLSFLIPLSSIIPNLPIFLSVHLSLLLIFHLSSPCHCLPSCFYIFLFL